MEIQCFKKWWQLSPRFGMLPLLMYYFLFFKFNYYGNVFK